MMSRKKGYLKTKNQHTAKFQSNAIVPALFITLAIPVLIYLLIGWLPGMIHLIFFSGGFVLWLLMPASTPWERIKIPYFVVLFLFAFHRIDEEVSGFFPALAEITSIPKPEFANLSGMMLVAGIAVTVLSLIWALSPILIRWKQPLGYFGAWSFFFAMGGLELYHFIFPFFTPESYVYFPGMISVAFLAPAAWWAMWRLYKY